MSFAFIVSLFERVTSALEELVLRESTAKSFRIVTLSALDTFWYRASLIRLFGTRYPSASIEVLFASKFNNQD